MSCCQPGLQERFEAFYAAVREPVNMAIERQVRGCDYGASSWTSRDESERIAGYLQLKPGIRCLDIGSGAGWPGLYFAKLTGCDVTLVDLPLAGARMAAKRAKEDRIEERVTVVVGDATSPPLADGSFDAVSHSDLLCCLEPKAPVLSASRRLIARRGRMAFTVISTAPGLSPEDHARALENCPEWVEADTSYDDMLSATGWEITTTENITNDYAEITRRHLEADQHYSSELTALIGAQEYGERVAGWRSRLSAIVDGLIVRELFVAVPAR